MKLFTSRVNMLTRRSATWVLLAALAVIIAMVFISIGAFTDQGTVSPTAMMATSATAMMTSKSVNPALCLIENMTPKPPA